MKALHMLSHILVIVGGLNLGLSALGINVVNLILGGFSSVEFIVYILVGLSAVYLLIATKEWRGGFSSSVGGAM